jgi:hypothetical protein
MARIVAEARKAQEDRAGGYRERAMALFPHVCGRCGREFSGKNLSELTVHHKDSNHFNNPPDGSNWELLCVACHEEEHLNSEATPDYDGGVSDPIKDPTLFDNPFAGLGDLIKPDADEKSE